MSGPRFFIVGAEVSGCGFDPIATVLLCPVEGVVGKSDQVFAIFYFFVRSRGDADADRYPDFATAAGESHLFNFGTEAFGNRNRLVLRGLRQGQTELLAAETGGSVVFT